ncbi:pilus assembly protein [Sulfitobacter guttiformis]|nr:Tad domain-containing protein [Sulfitobacter guttiformis]
MKIMVSTHPGVRCTDQSETLFPQRFVRREDGSMTVFAITVILLSLIVGGIGVDLMRNEMERVRLQNTADRAVLAATDLDQSRDKTAVVLDYFDKAGLGHLISAQDVTVSPGLSSRTVSVDLMNATPTNFMPLIGISSLPVPTRSAAIDDAPNIEISLVLDISGSMRFDEKIDKLRPAAQEFVGTVLRGEAAQRTSVNFIPYAGQTNPGREMFHYLRGTRLNVTALDQSAGGIPSGQSNGTLPAGFVGGTGSNPAASYVYPNVSSCLDIAPRDFGGMGLPPAGLFGQTAHFMNWEISRNADDLHGGEEMEWGWCPQDHNAIKYMSNDRDALQSTIQNMRMHDGTGTHYAMKWALALLDPNSVDAMNAMIDANVAPEAFRDRPAPFNDEDTTKYIVLMTDGAITEQVRPINAFLPRNLVSPLRAADKTTITNAATNVQSFYDQCALAKAQSPRPVIVFTIAFSASSAAQTQMRNCASSPAHFFNADNNNISNTFRNIARQINQLRLTQ